MSNHIILLVDDNVDDVALTLRAFEKCDLNADIIVARDGTEAVGFLLPTDGGIRLYPAIVLLDISMPKMSGLEVLRALRADISTKFQPVIMLTSSLNDRDLIESYDLGANGYVKKPVDTNDFLEAAKAIGVFWLGINKRPTPDVIGPA